MSGSLRIRLVVFDWAGTTVDHGCFAPIRPFLEALATAGLSITADEARGPMGLHKKDHLRALLALPEVDRRWRAIHGSAPTEQVVETLYTHEFVPRQMAALEGAGRLIAGVCEAVTWLRTHRIGIGSSTGYFREALDDVAGQARAQGYAPDATFCPGDVAGARPAPWMIFRNMEALGVWPPAAVVKVGDTVPDVEEGRNAGVWSVGVARTGSEVGLTAEALAALPAAEQAQRIAHARTRLLAAGAHHVVDAVADLPTLVPIFDARLARGERP